MRMQDAFFPRQRVLVKEGFLALLSYPRCRARVSAVPVATVLGTEYLLTYLYNLQPAWPLTTAQLSDPARELLDCRLISLPAPLLICRLLSFSYVPPSVMSSSCCPLSTTRPASCECARANRPAEPVKRGGGKRKEGMARHGKAWTGMERCGSFSHHHADATCAAYRAQPVGDHERRARLHEAVDGLLHL